MNNYRSTRLRAMFSFGRFPLLLCAAIFLAARGGWTKGWVFLLVFLLQMLIAVIYLWCRNPDVIIARRKFHAGTKGWDKVVLLCAILTYVAMFVTAELDSRFHWSSAPLWLVVLGYVVFSIGMAISIWVLSVNKFAERGVRIQTERGHTVIDTGPYAIVRHPFYFAIFFLLFSIPLALGSFWAMIPAAMAALVFIVRTALEDRTLQEELEGYKEYSNRVRYRLIPGVW